MIYSFEDFELDTQQRELRHAGHPRDIEPQVFSILELLVSNHDRMVSKDELNEKIWGGRIVSEAALSSRMSSARGAILDNGKSQRLIKTLHGQGFRFIGDLTVSGELPPKSISKAESNKSLSEPLDWKPARHSIAVLKFDNMSDDKEQAYFANGLCEDIITVLAKIPGLYVIARNSSFAFKAEDAMPDIKSVGRELDVHYILEGSVRRQGDIIRVTAQLIDTVTGLHAWAERYDRSFEDIFSLQDDITREIVSALQISLTAGEKARLWASGTENYKAWENLIRARFMMFTNNQDNVDKARALVEESVSLDENYASALTWLAFSHWQDIINGWTEDFLSAFMKAKEFADKSMAIDPDNPDTLSVMAFLSLAMRDHKTATTLAEKAVEIGPNDPTALGCLGFIDFYCERPERAAEMMKKGLHHTQDFFVAYYPTMEAGAYYLIKDYNNARETINLALEHDSNYAFAYVMRAVIDVETNEIENAKDAVIKARTIDPKLSLNNMNQVMPFMNPGTFERVKTALLQAGMPE